MKSPFFSAAGRLSAGMGHHSGGRKPAQQRKSLRYRVDRVRWGVVVEHSHEHIARF
jgi:hypothetical protein